MSWTKLPLRVLLVAILIGAWLYIRYGCETVWETSLSPRQPVVRLRVFRDVSTFALAHVSTERRVQFKLASDFTYAHRWVGDIREEIDAKHLTECSPKGGTIELLLEGGARVGEVECTSDPERNTLQFKATFDPPKAAVDSGEKNDPARPPNAPAYVDVFLVPVVEQPITPTSTTVHRSFPSSIYWRHVVIGGVLLPAETCPPNTLEAPAGCGVAGDILGTQQRILLQDPQRAVVELARKAAEHIVPMFVMAMILVDVLLVVLLVYEMIFLFDSRKRSPVLPISAESRAERGHIAKLYHIDGIFLGQRRLFEWLEVTGPALGFLLTVGALLIAFESRALVHGDILGFSNAISLAMAATFAGLVMRILAFSADRLLDYLLRKHADVSPMGIVTPARPDDDASGAERPKSGGQT